MLRRTQAADSGLNGKPYLVVIIRFSSSRSFPVTIYAESTIRDLKKEIAKKQDVSPSDLRLILAGQSLKDDFKLSVSQYAVLFVWFILKGEVLG